MDKLWNSQKIFSGTLILGGKIIRSDILSKTDGFVRFKEIYNLTWFVFKR